MAKFLVYIDDYEWGRYVKNQTIKYEISDGHLADVLQKTFKTVEVERTNDRYTQRASIRKVDDKEDEQ